MRWNRDHEGKCWRITARATIEKARPGLYWILVIRPPEFPSDVFRWWVAIDHTPTLAEGAEESWEQAREACERAATRLMHRCFVPDDWPHPTPEGETPGGGA